MNQKQICEDFDVIDDMPKLLLTGEADYLVGPSVVQKFARSVDEVAVISECGHFSIEEQADQVAINIKNLAIFATSQWIVTFYLFCAIFWPAELLRGNIALDELQTGRMHCLQITVACIFISLSLILAWKYHFSNKAIQYWHELKCMVLCSALIAYEGWKTWPRIDHPHLCILHVLLLLHELLAAVHCRTNWVQWRVLQFSAYLIQHWWIYI